MPINSVLHLYVDTYVFDTQVIVGASKTQWKSLDRYLLVGGGTVMEWLKTLHYDLYSDDDKVKLKSLMQQAISLLNRYLTTMDPHTARSELVQEYKKIQNYISLKR